MSKSLVIVESPAKAKTIGKILGKKYKVVASVGHVRDLPKSRLGIDLEDNYQPGYITIRGKGPVVKELKAEAKKVDKIYLATDPDREGEAISWHLAHILGIDDKAKVRVEFNEVTKEAIKNAIKKPRTIDLDLVDSQQARRILDRIVGYKISPLLWRKIRKGLSAGRVQSVAVKLICDREEEIKKFIPEEYWSIKVKLNKGKEKFEADFYGKTINSKDTKIELKNKSEVDKVLEDVDLKNFIVRDVKKGTRRRNPYSPYITSTLQQDASKKLNFTTKKTMMVAQQLYEGIDIKGEGTEGLITYMRTDSIRVSDEAVLNTCNFIKENYGDKYTTGGNSYSGKSKKGSQDAHESIRPTSTLRTPTLIKTSLTNDQYKLYKLIWERFVGSQMTPAVYDNISVNIDNNGYLFKARGSKLKFDGFLKIYISSDEEEKDMDIPLLNEDDKLTANKIDPNQHFTQPPGRYSEASLIKILEELGIGRPSTFAPTIGTILAREYVVLDKKTFNPTDLGILVNDLLKEYFKDVVNEKFTANLEERLDGIAEGEIPWVEVVDEFYKEFKVFLEKAEEEIEEVEIEDEVTDEICEKCGKNMVIKRGRFGKFLACPGYPECKNTKAIMDELNVKCPKCDEFLVRRRSKKGRMFYGCKGYPKCDFVSWDEPIEEKCPQCKGLLLLKKTKKEQTKKCFDEECGYTNVEKI